MKTLREPDKYVAKYLGTQKEEYGVKYKLNPYLIETDGAVYNAFTGEVILTDGDDTNAEFIRRWFLIPETYDVKTLTDVIYRSRCRFLPERTDCPKRLYVIFTTTACNASCSYCFEKGYKHVTMSEKIALDVADYIIATCNKKETIRIKWFGGEPLVNKKAISIICEKIQNAGISFVSSMTTNGYLFTKCSDDEIKSWKLRSVQLTVDDTGERYGLIKGLPSDAYSSLLKTAERLAALGLKIQLRIHYNPSLGVNVCKKIVDDFKYIPKLSMYSRILYGMPNPEHYKSLLEVEDYIESCGKMTFGLPKNGRIYHCMVDNPEIATIGPGGELSPCEHYPYGDHSYGSIYSKKLDENKLNEWKIKEKYENPNCAECPIYPICKKLVSCPAEDSCDNGYRDYKINYIKRVLRKKVEELGYQNN